MFELETLPNGARILSAPMRDAASVAVVISVAAGSRCETPEVGGIAHFSEHMFFKGTEQRPTARDISAEIDGIGGEFNAFTGKELTAYYVKCAAADAGTAVDVLSDMFLHSTFDEEELEREKGVIAEEINMYTDTPRDIVGQVYDTARYGDSPIGRPIIGTKETVRAATRQTFLDYLGAWYRPERIAIGLGGNVTDALLADVRERFGALPGEPTPPLPETVIPAITEPLVAIERRDGDQAHIVLGVDGMRSNDEDRYAMAVWQAVIGGGMSSRLFTEVRERRGLAYYVFGRNAAYTDTGSFAVQAGVDINRASLAVEVIAQELRRMVDEPIPAEEIQKAKRYLIGHTVLNQEDPSGRIFFGLRRELLDGGWVDLATVIKGIEAVTPEDLQRVGRRVVTLDRAVLAGVGPLDDVDGLRAALGA
jgi:predicted Zn-dependent peptidase